MAGKFGDFLLMASHFVNWLSIAILDFSCTMNIKQNRGENFYKNQHDSKFQSFSSRK